MGHSSSRCLHLLPEVDQYFTLGNEAADRAAIQAATRLQPAFVSELETQHQETRANQTLLEQVFKLHLSLQQDRQIAEATALQQQPQQQTATAIEAAFASWSVEQPQPAMREPTTRFLQHCPWGEECANALIQWTRLLVWPTDAQAVGPTGQHTGVSWAELTLSFLLYYGHFIPVPRKRQDGAITFLQPGTHAAAAECKITLAEQTTQLTQLWDNVQSLTPEPLSPAIKRQKVSAMYIQGSPRWSRGWTIRPGFYKQHEVAAWVRWYLVERNDWRLEAMPQLLTLERPCVTFSTPVEQAKKSCAQWQREVRRLRKA